MKTDQPTRQSGGSRASFFDRAPLFLLLPFALLWWMVPPWARLTIGQDYPMFGPPQQVELLFALKTGTFALFVPGFAGGQGWAALTLGQLLHPISLCGLLPGFWSGHSLDWATTFRIFSLGVAHLVTHRLVRRLSVPAAVSFTISMATVYNLRMLDLFRYSASLEAWTGHLFLCAALGFLYLDGPSWKSRAAVAASAYGLTVSGHPQMSYYGWVATALFALLFPFVADLTRAGAPRLGRRAFWLAGVSCMAVGGVLASAYTLPFLLNFMADNSGRVNQGYRWSLQFSDPLRLVLASFVAPLKADVHGAFGGTVLPLAALCAPIAARLSRRPVPAPIIAAWGVAVVVLLAASGGATPVHRIIWHVLPFASSFRVPGRIVLLLPWLFLLLLVWFFSGRRTRFEPMRESLILGGMCLTLSLLPMLMPGLFPPDQYSAQSIRNLAPPQMIAVSLLAAFAAALLAVNLESRQAQSAWVVLAFVACLQTSLVMENGTWVRARTPSASFAQLANAHARDFRYRQHPGVLMENASVALLQGRPVPPLGRLWTTWTPALNDAEARRLSTEQPDRPALQRGAPPEPPEPVSGRVTLTSSSFNRFVFSVSGAAPGSLFVLGQPLSPFWRAFVNGAPVPTSRADACYPAAEVPAGDSRIEWRFVDSATAAGVAISTATLAALGLVAAWRRRIIWPGVAACLLAALIFFGWRQSLYTGDDIGVRYEWRAP